ncbi:MAG TPA: hypothetical protein VLV88_01925 [Terriglobales bacterium]|nr:hypothetical protein [Terriglobales bacterium]
MEADKKQAAERTAQRMVASPRGLLRHHSPFARRLSAQTAHSMRSRQRPIHHPAFFKTEVLREMFSGRTGIDYDLTAA